MYDRTYLHIQNDELREEYISHLKKLIHVLEVSSYLSYSIAEYKKAIELNDVELQGELKKNLLYIIEPSGLKDITLKQAQDPNFSSKILLQVFNTVLFNLISFVVTNSTSKNITINTVDDEILSMLIDDDSEGINPEVVFDMLYNNLVSKTKLKA